MKWQEADTFQGLEQINGREHELSDADRFAAYIKLAFTPRYLMKIEQETLSKIQSIATILSSVAIPIVIALVGWWVQSSVSNEGIKKDYVQMAVGILKDTEKQKDEEMRKWAVAVLDKNSPVPFSSDLRSKLEKGAVFVSVSFPSPPEVLMKPPLKLQPLPNKKSVTMGDLLSTTVENYGRCHENAITLEYLQKWVSEMQDIHERRLPSSMSPDTALEMDAPKAVRPSP